MKNKIKKLKLALDVLKDMLKDKQQQIQDEPNCNLWKNEETQLIRAIELVEIESEIEREVL